MNYDRIMTIFKASQGYLSLFVSFIGANSAIPSPRIAKDEGAKPDNAPGGPLPVPLECEEVGGVLEFHARVVTHFVRWKRGEGGAVRTRWAPPWSPVNRDLLSPQTNNLFLLPGHSHRCPAHLSVSPKSEREVQKFRFRSIKRNSKHCGALIGGVQLLSKPEVNVKHHNSKHRLGSISIFCSLSTG